MLFAPLISFDAIERDALNDCLVRWDHKMGPLERPMFGVSGNYGLRHADTLVAVIAHDSLITAETCELSRKDSFELSRVCAVRPGLCRVVLRLWREFVFPRVCEAGRYNWVISYQDRVAHKGDIYRLDGWVRHGNTSSGTDTRAKGGIRRGRKKTVWGWTSDPDLMLAARARERGVYASKKL